MGLAKRSTFSSKNEPGGGSEATRRQASLRRHHLQRTANLLREELKSRGFRVLPGETAIVPVVIEEELDLCRLCKALLEDGIYINPVLRPAAAQNLLRISCTAAHTERHVDRLMTALVKRTRELGIES